MLRHVRFLLGILCLGFVSATATGQFVAERLTCEYLQNPLGIDEAKPRLSWTVRSDHRGVTQTAYRIIVASSKEKLAADQGDKWDSGKRAGPDTVLIPYEGKPLGSRERCYWKVRSWDQDDEPSAWSEPAIWTMGLREDSDWEAHFISYSDTSPVYKKKAPLFLPAARQYRRDFEAHESPVKRATIYATALGVYELQLNGQRVGDALLMPGWTDYNSLLHYQTYDVTPHLRQNKGQANAIGAYVADGWYAGYLGFGLLESQGTEGIGRYIYGKTPSVAIQLEIEYENGDRQVIATDKGWKVTGEGPIREADLLMGETYDARKEQTGWAEAGFDDSSWDQAILAEENGNPTANFHEHNSDPDGVKYVKDVERPIELGFKQPHLEAFNSVPIEVTEELPVRDVSEPSPGAYIFDFGQNFAGVVRLKVKGTAGQKITLRHGEMLHPDGRLMTANLRKARAIDTYICRGGDVEVWQPRFTTHGFRYVELTGLTEPPTPEIVTGLVLHSNTPIVSEFECSDPMVNRLYQNVLWTQRSNFIDLPTDCPQRDERLGWTGDGHIYMRTATMNAEVGAFYTKWIHELMTAQRPSGAFPGFAPYMIQNDWDFGTAYTDAGVICPWTLWQAYGDTRILKDSWRPMLKFMKWREKNRPNHLGMKAGHTWGDWLSLEPTPIEFVDTIYFAYSAKLLAEIAGALGHSEEAERLDKLFDNIKQAFQGEYLTDQGRLKVDSQTAHALTLWVGLAPQEYNQGLADRLAEKIRDNGNRMTTGFLGTYPLLKVLSENGHHDVASFLLQSRSFPSWGYEIENGATTIWERWDSYTKGEGFGKHNAEMNSFSHYAFGSVCEWMLRTLAGIDNKSPGYDVIRIHPMPPNPNSNGDYEPINWTKASYDSLRGPIKVDWRVENQDFHLACHIPANTTAEVSVPGDDANQVTENGTPISEVEGVARIRSEAGRVVFSVGSGAYEFKSLDAIQPANISLHVGEPQAN